ncbi:hypothetical protein NP493_156g01018 [Ridgeia piscesae]|uniref:Cilia- and flagella-associated protein 263 n=1 Tax=Ridgeia piscesae TaxID=27915 RepID=A0AAD9P3Y8_RIDPI|nr:hypothetical protein NP493_156g01018 [Ridgeia piscesae]
MAESVTSSITENPDDPLLDLSDEQLSNLLEDTLHGNEVLAGETQMFEKFLKRVEPKDAALGAIVGGLQPNILSASTTPSHSTHDLSGSRMPRKRSKSRSSTTERTLKLNAEQKCDIAQREIEELKEEIERLEEESEKVLDHFKAVMEEADTRLTEIKKDYYEFERDIMKGALNQQTGKFIAEKVIRYLEDKLRSRDTLIEKLRLKNATLKVQKKKLIMQLKQKEEMGEVLHEVDFNQLKIENQQYIEKIDERNQDLLRLKLMAGNTLQILNSYKKKLMTLTMESERLKSEIASRHELLARIDTETKIVERQRGKAERINRRLRQQIGAFHVPDVMEYVTEKAELYELKKNVRSWERKVEIVEMALKTNRKAWQKIKLVSQPSNPWAMATAN